MKTSPKLRLKIIILGEGGVGKTTLSKSFEQNKEFITTTQTIGIDIHIKRIEFEGIPCTIQLWDLGGQDQFKNMGAFTTFCSGAHGAILCFDLSDLNTFNQLDQWIKFLPPSTPFILVGTKADIESSDQFLQQTIMTWVKKKNCLNYLETRYDRYESIHKAFYTLILEVIKRHLSEIESFLKNYNLDPNHQQLPIKIANIIGEDIILQPDNKI